MWGGCWGRCGDADACVLFIFDLLIRAADQKKCVSATGKVIDSVFWGLSVRCQLSERPLRVEIRGKMCREAVRRGLVGRWSLVGREGECREGDGQGVGKMHGTRSVPCVAGGASSWECVQQKKKPERRWWNHTPRPYTATYGRCLERTGERDGKTGCGVSVYD